VFAIRRLKLNYFLTLPKTIVVLNSNTIQGRGVACSALVESSKGHDCGTSLHIYV